MTNTVINATELPGQAQPPEDVIIVAVAIGLVVLALILLVLWSRTIKKQSG